MKNVNRVTLTVSPPEDRYGVRSFSIGLSDEILIDKDIATITGIVQMAALKKDFLFEASTSQYEVCESDEEKEEKLAKEKAEKEERDLASKALTEDLMAKVLITLVRSFRTRTSTTQWPSRQLSTRSALGSRPRCARCSKSATSTRLACDVPGPCLLP